MLCIPILHLPSLMRHLFLNFGGEFVGGCLVYSHNNPCFSCTFLLAPSFMLDVNVCIIFVLFKTYRHLTRPIKNCSQHTLNTIVFMSSLCLTQYATPFFKSITLNVSFSPITISLQHTKVNVKLTFVSHRRKSQSNVNIPLGLCHLTFISTLCPRNM